MQHPPPLVVLQLGLHTKMNQNDGTAAYVARNALPRLTKRNMKVKTHRSNIVIILVQRSNISGIFVMFYYILMIASTLLVMIFWLQ